MTLKLSVSRWKQYYDCAYAYYLSRIKKVWQKPAAWFPQGTAVHAVFEAYEKSGRTMTLAEAEVRFSVEYAKATAVYAEHTPNLDYWHWSGPYNGETDLPRRHDKGIEQIRRWYQYRADNPDDKPWTTPDGEPAIELPFEIDLEGVAVRGYIDVVEERRAGGLRAVDYKTGKRPGDEFQLATYATAVEKLHGVRPSTGAYYMAAAGNQTVPSTLKEWPTDRVAGEFHRLWDDLEAERFPASPEPSKCRFCSVSASCKFALG